MPQGVREQVLQDVRDWMAGATGATGTDLIASDEDMPKADKPFILVDEGSHLNWIGTPETDRRRNSGRVEERTLIYVSTDFTFTAFGAGAIPWLEDLSVTMWRQDMRALLNALAINPIPTSGQNDQTVTLAGSKERRLSQDWRCEYQIASSWYDASAEFSRLEFSGHLRDYADQPDSAALDFSMVATD